MFATSAPPSGRFLWCSTSLSRVFRKICLKFCAFLKLGWIGIIYWYEEFKILVPANGSLPSCIPVYTDSHSVALRLHLPLFPCGLFPGFSSSLSLPSVVFSSPFGFLAGLWLSLKLESLAETCLQPKSVYLIEWRAISYISCEPTLAHLCHLEAGCFQWLPALGLPYNGPGPFEVPSAANSQTASPSWQGQRGPFASGRDSGRTSPGTYYFLSVEMISPQRIASRHSLKSSISLFFALNS